MFNSLVLFRENSLNKLCKIGYVGDWYLTHVSPCSSSVSVGVM